MYNQKELILIVKLTMRKRAASDKAFIFTSRSIGTIKVNITFIQKDFNFYKYNYF